MVKQPLIELKHIFKTYRIGERELTVLKNINLTVYHGELLAIVGASGSGKSTLMNLLGLLDKPNSGDYWLEGKAVSTLHPDKAAQLRNHHIGFVFQQFNLLPRLNAAQNVALPLTYRTLAKQDLHKRVDEALEQVGMLAYKTHKPQELSGGQQQRVAIARALVSNPNALLADEPTGALDSKTGQEIMKLFGALHQTGRTIILVTHDEAIANMCERKVTFADGEIIKDESGISSAKSMPGEVKSACK